MLYDKEFSDLRQLPMTHMLVVNGISKSCDLIKDCLGCRAYS